jgi:hypothetical protein
VEPDFEMLREIARITGGEAFSADDPLGLELCLRAIDGLEKATLPVDVPTEGRPLAWWLLVFSAAPALALAIDLAKKRGQRPPVWLTGRGR